MHVLLVSSGSGSRGGGEIYLNVLANGLLELGCAVSVLVPSAPIMDEMAENFPRSVRVLRVPYRSTYERKMRGIGAAWDHVQQSNLIDCFARINPDIVHINQQVAEDGLDLVRAAISAEVPWVSTLHVARSAVALKAKLGRLRDIMAIRTLRNSKGQFIVVSNASKSQLMTRIQRKKIPIHVVHNGVVAMCDEALKAARIKARHAWGVSENEIVVGVVGRIEAQKNPLGLIEYLKAAKCQQTAKAVWIGDGALRSELQSCAQDNSVRLHIDGWRSDASTRMAGFDIFMLPSKFEGLPLAMLEAMHVGLPVIASNTDGVPEAIENAVSGFLCDTAEDWRVGLGKLVEQARLREQLGAAAKAKAARSFSQSAMAKATLEIYNGILACA